MSILQIWSTSSCFIFLETILCFLVGVTILEFPNLPSICSNESELLPAQTWEYYSDWPSIHPVKSIFNEFIQVVVDAKGAGIGASHSTPTLQELRALEQGAQRLVSAGVQDGWGEAHRDKWS